MTILLHKHFISLLRDRKGSALIFVIIGAATLVMAVGAAVDMSRLQTLQARVSHALDAAGLAAGATANSIPTGFESTVSQPQRKLDWIQSQATRYFAANIPVDYLGSNVLQPVNITVQQGGNSTACATSGTICLTATATQKTTFMRVAGITQMTVHTRTEISLAQQTGLELVLALDNTGSMNAALGASQPTKLAALKTSVANLLDVLYGSNDTVPTPDNSTFLLWVGLVPYSDMVNLGKTFDRSIDAGVRTYSASYLPPGYISDPKGIITSHNWTGCFDARTVSDPNPSLNPTPSLITSNTLNTVGTGSRTFRNISSSGLGFTSGQGVVAYTTVLTDGFGTITGLPDATRSPYYDYIDYMKGTVSRYSGTSLSMNVTSAFSSNEKSDSWVILPAGPFYGNDSCSTGFGSNSCSLASNNLSYDISLTTSPTFTPLDNSSYNTNASVTDAACPQQIIPMQSSKSVISTAVANMTAQGNTMINIGAAWAWRMMNSGGPWPVLGTTNPSTGQAWAGGPAGGNFAPTNLSSVSSTYTTLVNGSSVKENKVLIIMTDGANTDPGVGCQTNKACPLYTSDNDSNPNGLCCPTAQPPLNFSQPYGEWLNGTTPSNGGGCCSSYSDTCTGLSCSGDGVCTQATVSDTSGYSCTCCAGLNGCSCEVRCTGYSNTGSCTGSATTCNKTAINGGGGHDRISTSIFCPYYKASNANAYQDITTADISSGNNADNNPGGTEYQAWIDSYGDENAWPYQGWSYMEDYILNTPQFNVVPVRGAAPRLDNLTENVCQAIKDQGITVYTIGFGTADGGINVNNPSCNSAQCSTYVNGQLLKDCASPGKYYFANSATSLQGVFQTIGNSLNHLRISQ